MLQLPDLAVLKTDTKESDPTSIDTAFVIDPTRTPPDTIAMILPPIAPPDLHLIDVSDIQSVPIPPLQPNRT
jgi:hypothetical protein